MRSLPDIYKGPRLYIYVEDTVLIPDAPETPPEAEEEPEASVEALTGAEVSGGDSYRGERFDEGEVEGLGDEEEVIEEEEVELPERRQGDRRATGRRADDSESLDSLVRRYKERLALSKEELYEELEPEMQSELRRQVAEHQADLRRKAAEHDEELQRQAKEHQGELQKQLMEQQAALQRQMAEQQEETRQQAAEARSEAYRDVLIEKKEAITEALGLLEKSRKSQEQGFADFINEFTAELKYMALDIAERILHREIDENIHALDLLVLQQVAEVKNTSWINVEVTDRIDGLAEHLKDRLDKAEQGKLIFVETKDAPADTCRIVTEEGVVDATLSIQLRQLREAFVKAEGEGE